MSLDVGLPGVGDIKVHLRRAFNIWSWSLPQIQKWAEKQFSFEKDRNIASNCKASLQLVCTLLKIWKSQNKPSSFQTSCRLSRRGGVCLSSRLSHVGFPSLRYYHQQGHQSHHLCFAKINIVKRDLLRINVGNISQLVGIDVSNIPTNSNLCQKHFAAFIVGAAMETLNICLLLKDNNQVPASL